MTHTKGKWVINGIIIEDNTGYPIARVWPNTKLSSAKSVELIKANACLIAAAPELLAACEMLLEAYRLSRPQVFGTDAVEEEARAAIAAAKGDQPAPAP